MTLRKDFVAEYNAWVNMKQRCENKDHPEYFRYGGRGIIVESQLQTFEGFFITIGPRLDTKLSLDRIKKDGNYSVGNIRWADKTTQSFNQRVSVDCRSGITGVQYRDKFNTYRCYITKHGKRVHLGSTRDFFEACCIRKSAEVEYYKELYDC